MSRITQRDAGSPNTSQVVVKALEKLGIGVAFGIPGMWSLPIYDALCDSKIRHVLVRHEQFAAYAADGYARASGKPGFCLGTAGPGAVNIAAGIAVPFRDHSPVIAVTGQVPTFEQGKGWIEDLDLQAIFSPVTKSTAQISDPTNAYETITAAYLSSIEGCPGPSHVSIPGDIQKAPSKMRDYSPLPSKPEPDPSAIDQVMDAIASSQAPLIISGWGAILSESSEGILKLAEALPAPVTTSYMGRGIIPEDNPLSLGPAGRRGTKEANAALSRCDLLITLGCRLTNLTVAGAKLTCKVVQVDVDENNFSSYASVRVKSDVALFLDAILPKIQHRSGELNPLMGSVSELPEKGEAPAFARAIASFNDALFSLDIGQHTIWLMHALKVKRPRSVILSGNLSAMGYSLPAAIGAKLASPERRVIVVIGDGGFQMTAPELSTIRENDLDISICVFNNRTLGLIKQQQEVVYGRTCGVDYTRPPDYVKLAQAYGIKGLKIDSPSALKEALQIADEPTVFDIPIPKKEGVEMSRPRILDNQ
ncbi:MAG: thiamine pyrophosphate-binding protein [Candidatus Methanomethylicaceae archaeon]